MTLGELIEQLEKIPEQYRNHTVTYEDIDGHIEAITGHIEFKARSNWIEIKL